MSVHYNRNIHWR